MEVRLLEPFGVEISGVRLEALDDEARDGVRALVCRHRVAVVRGQTLGDREFADFLGAMGDIMLTEAETPVPGEPRLNVVTNVGRTRPPRSVFHTDTSYVARPPAFTALRAVQVPDSGGETEFSDQVAAFAALDGAERERLQSQRLRHAWTPPGREERPTDSVWHPLARRHAETGEVALYLSTPERCAELSDDGAARATIERLYAASTRPEGLLRHRWREGDVVIWDDRATLHRADHSAVVGARTFHRGMVRGEKPVAAFS